MNHLSYLLYIFFNQLFFSIDANILLVNFCYKYFSFTDIIFIFFHPLKNSTLAGERIGDLFAMRSFSFETLLAFGCERAWTIPIGGDL